ncbi:hypothetical protein KKB28_01760 [bacterium]|nr:hypothetical protein [bacterium]
MKFAIFLMVLLVIASSTFAAEASSTWQIEPAGRAWLQLYAPHSEEYYADLAAEILAQVHSPNQLSFFIFVQFLTASGYATTPRIPHLHTDVLSQFFQQGLGIRYNSRIPAYLFLHRDCHHRVDIYDVEPESWTTLIFGLGTMHFYSSSPLLSHSKTRHLCFRYFVGGGPVLKDTPVVPFDFNNPVTSESFARALVVWPRWKHASLDLFLDSGLQTTWTETKWRGHLATELGFTLHSGKSGWRFYWGYRWRDTRWLRPIDQRSYWGVSFVF